MWKVLSVHQSLFLVISSKDHPLQLYTWHPPTAVTKATSPPQGKINPQQVASPKWQLAKVGWEQSWVDESKICYIHSYSFEGEVSWSFLICTFKWALETHHSRMAMAAGFTSSRKGHYITTHTSQSPSLFEEITGGVYENWAHSLQQRERERETCR